MWLIERWNSTNLSAGLQKVVSYLDEYLWFTNLSLIWKWWEDDLSVLPSVLVSTVEDKVWAENWNDRNVLDEILQLDAWFTELVQISQFLPVCSRDEASVRTHLKWGEWRFVGFDISQKVLVLLIFQFAGYFNPLFPRDSQFKNWNCFIRFAQNNHIRFQVGHNHTGGKGPPSSRLLTSNVNVTLVLLFV